MAISINSFKKALFALDEALQLFNKALTDSPEQKAFRDSCIHRFEFCVELAWKTSMHVLGSSVKSAKPAVREMARNNLIENPTVWLDFIDARNETSHTYEEQVAMKVFMQVLKFSSEGHRLLKKLEEHE